MKPKGHEQVGSTPTLEEKISQTIETVNSRCRVLIVSSQLGGTKHIGVSMPPMH